MYSQLCGNTTVALDWTGRDMYTVEVYEAKNGQLISVSKSIVQSGTCSAIRHMLYVTAGRRYEEYYIIIISPVYTRISSTETALKPP